MTVIFRKSAVASRTVAALAASVVLMFGAAAISTFAVSPAAQPAGAPGASAGAPLSVDAAFPVLASVERGKVVLRVDVLPGHYLYRDRFELALDGKVLDGKPPAAGLNLPKGKMKADPNFGRVEIYDHPVVIAAPMKPASGTAAGATEVRLVFQGCSEAAGVCYPPTTRTFAVTADSKDVAPRELAPVSLKQQLRKQVSQ